MQFPCPNLPQSLPPLGDINPPLTVIDVLLCRIVLFVAGRFSSDQSELAGKVTSSSLALSGRPTSVSSAEAIETVQQKQHYIILGGSHFYLRHISLSRIYMHFTDTFRLRSSYNIGTLKYLSVFETTDLRTAQRYSTLQISV